MVAAPQNYNLNYNSSIAANPLMSAPQLAQAQGQFTNPGQMPTNQQPSAGQFGSGINSQLLSHLQGQVQNNNQQGLGAFQNAYNPANVQHLFDVQNAQSQLGNQAYGQLIGQQGNAFNNAQQYQSLLLNGMGGLIPGLGSLLGGGMGGANGGY